MPLQNRVAPDGEILASAARGTMMGNRGGQLHKADRSLSSRRWVSRQWICCEIEFRGRQRQVMGPRSYTELFFLDEATALAAGHRPCFECRRKDARRFAESFRLACGLETAPSAVEMDKVLHSERLAQSGSKRTFPAYLDSLPAGTIVRVGDLFALYWDARLYPWSFEGYGNALSRAPPTDVEVATPRTIVEVLRHGYRPRVHFSAGIAG